MKNILAILLITIFLGSCGLNQTDKITITKNEETPKQYSATRDSILKETEYGSVYITKDTTVIMYSWLNTESIDTTVFNEMYSEENISEFLKINKIKMKHFRNTPVLGNWSSLYALNNQFYVYSPSDWLFNNRIMIADSALYHFGSDDWRIESIQNLVTEPNGDTHIALIGHNNEKIDLTIRFIDDDKTIAFWNRKSSDGYEYSELRVKSSEVRKFDMIVNDCLDMKCFQEFVFETPAYGEIIKTFGDSH